MFLIQIQLKNNTTPLLDWGKYWEKDVRIMVPISVQTHYSFIDGIHIGEFVDSLEKYFASLKRIISGKQSQSWNVLNQIS